MSNRFVYTYTGRKVGPEDEFDSPSLQDIAVSLGRICRYAGACVRFWPVLLHSMCVADLVPSRIQAAALLHDSTELLIGDIPRGMKTPELSAAEDIMFHKILTSLKIPIPSPDDWKIIKQADNDVLYAEVWTVGTAALRDYYPVRNPEIEDIVMSYSEKYSPLDCISPDGLAGIEFTRRFAQYREYAKPQKLVVFNRNSGIYSDNDYGNKGFGPVA